MSDPGLRILSLGLDSCTKIKFGRIEGERRNVYYL
jgi:hypothetical protein